jgi:hypothetical protein
MTPDETTTLGGEMPAVDSPGPVFGCTLSRSGPVIPLMRLAIRTRILRRVPANLLLRLKARDLRVRLALWVGFNALLWLVWGIEYAVTGDWFLWPLFYTVGSAIVIGFLRWRASRRERPAVMH